MASSTPSPSLPKDISQPAEDVEPDSRSGNSSTCSGQSYFLGRQHNSGSGSGSGTNNNHLAYDFTNARFHRVVDEQADDLPIHHLDWVDLANGDVLICSRHLPKVTAPKQAACGPATRLQQQHQRRIRFVLPTEQRRHRGLRKKIVELMDGMRARGREAWEHEGILSVCLVENTPQSMVWHVVRRRDFVAVV